MLKGFKEFALRGNVIDLAVGVIIGAAFQAIVNSLVNDIIMPLISLITGNVDFSNRFIHIGDVSIKYGSFITAIINFIIISLVVFLFIKYINKITRDFHKKQLDDLDKLDKFANKYDKKGIFKNHIAKKKRKLQKNQPEPTEKLCPFCFTKININATRCPFCTSKLSDKSKITENKQPEIEE